MVIFRGNEPNRQDNTVEFFYGKQIKIFNPSDWMIYEKHKSMVGFCSHNY